MKDPKPITASLRLESEKLARSWMRHDPALLRDYLVSGVEDPRINLQSILTRHFLVRALLRGEVGSPRFSAFRAPGSLSAERQTGPSKTALKSQFDGLMREEILFAAVMQWLSGLARDGHAEDESAVILHALRRRADNAEGIQIPLFVSRAFAALPLRIHEVTIPNYIEDALSGPANFDRIARTFAGLWSQVLLQAGAELPGTRLRVIEPACGSANDYRFLREYGLAPFLDYFGFDLCPKNVENARSFFPDARFETGNVFALPVEDASFPLCFVHDLFEHLSLEGIAAAMGEICRVTSEAIGIGFFNMREIGEHVIHPVEEYHWNTLSLARMRELFATHGFSAQVIHIGSFLRDQIGCGQTHNENAWTFWLARVS